MKLIERYENDDCADESGWHWTALIVRSSSAVMPVSTSRSSASRGSRSSRPAPLCDYSQGGSASPSPHLHRRLVETTDIFPHPSQRCQRTFNCPSVHKLVQTDLPSPSL